MGRAKRGARKHNHSQQIVHIAETKGGTDDEFDFVIGSLRASVGESEVCGGNNGREEELVDIEVEVPLSEIPKTGDDSGIWSILALISAAGMLCLLAIERKKRQEN